MTGTAAKSSVITNRENEMIDMLKYVFPVTANKTKYNWFGVVWKLWATRKHWPPVCGPLYGPVHGPLLRTPPPPMEHPKNRRNVEFCEIVDRDDINCIFRCGDVWKTTKDLCALKIDNIHLRTVSSPPFCSAQSPALAITNSTHASRKTTRLVSSLMAVMDDLWQLFSVPIFFFCYVAQI